VRHVGGSRGLPSLEVLRTSSPAEAAAFLAPWSSAREFGLFVQLASDSASRSQRVALLAISSGPRVMIFDLRPFLRREPRPLAPALAEFLGDESRTLFGLGLLRPAAQLAKEFNVTMRSVDMRVRAWPAAKLDGGVYRVAERLLGVALAPRPSMRQLDGQAVAAYLQWAVAGHCITAWGAPKAAWLLSEEDLAEVPAAKIRALRPSRALDAVEEPLARLEQAMRRRATQRLASSRRGEGKRERFASAREGRDRLARATQQAPRAGQ